MMVVKPFKHEMGNFCIKMWRY